MKKIDHYRQAARLAGLRPRQVECHCRNYRAPLHAQCFFLWHLCHKRRLQVRAVFADLHERATKADLAYWLYQQSAEYSAKHNARVAKRVKGAGKATRNASRRAWCARTYAQRRRSPTVRLQSVIRSRLQKYIVRGRMRKDYPTWALLGCDADCLRRWIEAFWFPGMTWQNYGQWHIDHVRPLASFDLTDDFQLRWACHYTNLQPLWATDNLKKGATYVSQI